MSGLGAAPVVVQSRSHHNGDYNLLPRVLGTVAFSFTAFCLAWNTEVQLVDCSIYYSYIIALHSSKYSAVQ
jgi:hypothetical protein